MDGGYERASTVGFRCARSRGPQPPQPPQPPPPPPPPPPPGPQPMDGPRPFPSLALGFRWSDGAPDASSGTRSANNGVYFAGAFQLQVKDSAEAGQARVLSLYVGAFCWGARLTASAGSRTASKTVAPAPQCSKAPAATQNVVWTVTFVGPLTLTWERNGAGGPSSPFRVPVCAARTLNVTGQSRVTLSLQ